jgi:hypothetical protein
MGSFRSKVRNHGLNRRRSKASSGRQGFPRIESLEDRRLLSGGDTTLTPLWQPTSTNLLDAQNGPMANLGVGIVNVYAAYAQNGNSADGLQAQFPQDEFQNGMVGLQLKSLGGDFSQYVSQLTEVGMNVTTSSAYYGLVEGFAPVNELPTIAQLAQTQSGSVIMNPIVHASNYQGAAYNEAETSMFADVARSQFKVDGTGVTVGVLSNSVSQYQGGLADSYKTGDLSASNPVAVLQDGPSGSDDEGRAMLENIHDVAPGASLAFATANGGPLAFGNNINALATTGKANVMVDDVSYALEPFFQDGVISQAVNNVTSQGVTYFSSAGNDGPDSGYLSTFRPASSSIAGIGSGVFMNFNPNGGTTLQLPITTSINNAEILFEYDQPYQIQEPAGSPGQVTSNVYIYVLDSKGNVVVGAAANSNNVATQTPEQVIVIPTAGSYSIAIQVVSGANPNHVEFVSFNDTNTAISVSQQFGTAGGTSYPTSYGHATAAATIGVGATPWWAPAPYLGQTPLASEPFSSSGPALYDLSIQGTSTTPVTVQNPTVTAPDGGNTSFFSPGTIISTATPPLAGQPATSTNLSQDLPSFFGTSSAAPNAAAVAALMKQFVPSATPAQIRASLIAGATTPLNGAAVGAWDQQGGYGLINAINALNAVDQLRVATTTPANGSTVTTAPSVIQVTFNKPVVFSSLSAADLTFTAAPAGVTVNVGAPIAVDNATDPTIVAFPISFTKAVGVLANGTYTFSIQSPTSGTGVVAEDGKTLVGSSPITFNLADTTAPTIVNTAVSGRTVNIQFSKAIDPSTVTLSNIFVLRKGTVAAWPPTPATLSSYINLNSDPRATISYNPLTFTVTIDYSNLPQTELPSDNYAIVVLSPTTPGVPGVSDLVGNALFGQFNGSFPTGQGETVPQDFIDNLGFQALQAPIITTFTMNPSSETGIAGQQNTNLSQPAFVGQVYVPFPGSIAGDQVYIQFGGTPTNNGNISLGVGGGGRGFTGSFDLSTTTNSSGAFSVTAPPLVQGFQTAVAVVVGQIDSPPLPGLSSALSDAFRIDQTPPQITTASLTQGGAALPLPNGGSPNTTNVSSLTGLSLSVVDPINPQAAPFGTPTAVQFAALNPTTVSNVSNYSLVNTTTGTDESAFIARATFVPQAPTVNAAGYITAFNGYINLTINPGLPSGQYLFTAHTHEQQYPGLADAAGNFLDDSKVTGESPSSLDFTLNLNLQNTPTYITSMAMESGYTSSGSSAIGGPQSYYELPPASGTNTRDNVPAPPNTVVIDLSQPIPYASANGTPINYSADVLLVRSADSANGAPDGDFGTLGEGGLGATGTGFTIVPATVTLYSTSNPNNPVNTPGASGNRLVLTINSSTPLPADYYRVYMPNQVDAKGNDTRIYDIFGNQLDGEFLGNPTTQNTPDFQPASPTVTLPQYQDELSNGTFRTGMSGDGVGGGAFTTGFAVVPYGNIVYTRPDFVENSLLPNGAGLSDGSLAKPYPVLAPEGDPNSALAANPTHDPHLGLNNPAFFQPGTFNLTDDLSGDGKYEQSALYAASQLAYTGPVVVVAEPGLPSRNPISGAVTQASFSLVAPAGNTSGAGGSASVPFDTTLVFQAGSTLKLQSASLFVQDQGSALQALGTPSNPVIFSSYNDATVGGATNNNPDTTPHAGDWGGIVFRNYDDAIAANQQKFPVDGILVGPNGGAAISGAQDAMSILNFATVKYGGGAVPQGSSIFYSGITLYNSRPIITNSSISLTGGTGGTEGAIGADMDALREDDTARGPLIRNDTVTGNSLNGIYLMAEGNGFIEPTNAMPYPTNPSTLGGSLNYTIADPLPIIVTAQFIVGQELLENTGGKTSFVGNRLYIQPGSMIKFNKGSGLDVLNPAASLNVGSRSYINGFDQNNNYSPTSSGFAAESATDPTVLFTSIYDDAATTPFVPAINVTGEKITPALGPAFWGSVGIITGADVVINAATFTYGGGQVNSPTFSIPSQSVLAFITFDWGAFFTTPSSFTKGTHAYITNNNFYHNFDTAMQIEPDGLLAGDPVRPLLSGHPFFRGNVMQGNGIDGLGVVADRLYLYAQVNGGNDYSNYIGPNDAINVGASYENLDVNSVWDLTDLTYVVRGTIILGGAGGFFNNNGIPVPNPTTFTSVPAPPVTLTIQSALPGTLLADGESIPSPGQSVIVKMLNDEPVVSVNNFAQNGANAGSPYIQQNGAGFVVGVDDGIDPPGGVGEAPIDPGAFSEIRILGIPGNQTTGQQRVPVIMTSLRDGSVGTTVRGVSMFNILESDAANPIAGAQGASLTTPAAGDGGVIYIGGNSMPEWDPGNPFDGSIIQNADISYMTRIEEQGAGLDYSLEGSNVTAPEWQQEKQGYGEGFLGAGPVGFKAQPINQLNSPMIFTIANSNLADFSSAGVFVHPEILNGYDLTTGKRAGFLGEGAYLYMYNDTVSNTPQGVHINSENSADTAAPSPEMAVIENTTFYNDANAIQTVAPQFNGTNALSHVYTFLMNDIFDGSSAIAVNIQGQAGESQLQYDLFFNNGQNTVITTTDGDFAPPAGLISGDPQFVGPVGPNLPATSQNFELQSTSPAIDAGRSEDGPLPAANVIYPGVDISLSGGLINQTRTDPSTLTGSEEPGFFNENGGFGFITDPRQIVTLPGTGYFSFPDQWQPVQTSDPTGYTTSYASAGTYNYQPYSGIRDLLGYIRVPDPNVPGVGYGSNPFIDIGAYQYVNLHPPEVTSVTATEASTTSSTGSATVPFYTVGGKAGANATPQTINVTFNEPIDPSTLTGQTVQLEELGIAPGTTQKFINLAGKLQYISGTNTLVINLAGLTLPTDSYRLILLGSGSPVIANTQGIALDGEDLSSNDDPNSGVTQALPSGNGYPGGNFYDPFIINTTPPSFVKGSLQMSPNSDTNIVGDDITTSASPTFTGTISEPNPNLVPLAGQTAILNVGIALNINGTIQDFFNASQLPAGYSQYAQYIRQDAGTGVTDASGNFSVTVGVDAANSGLVTNTKPLSDLFPILNVGSSGILSPLPGTDSGYYVAQVIAQDQSGNQSTPNANSQLPFVVDDTAPTAQVVSPTSGEVITSLTNGAIQFTITTDKNIDLTHFTAASIKVVSAGPDGVLGTADDVPVNINPSSIQATYLDKGPGGSGRMQITFSTTGTLTNNIYSVTLLNTGAAAVRDIAGNILASPVTQNFAVAIPSLATNLFVGGATFVTDPTATLGTRENPYPTIGAAIKAATAGDVVAVLPGVYTENVTLKQFVRLYSASATSTDSTVFTTSTGDPLSTVIRAPAGSATPVTVTATGLMSFPGLQTEVAGFTIASPLLGDPALGTLNSSADAVLITNSNVLIDKDYIADSGTGIFVVTSGAGAMTPQIEDDVIVGNVNGVAILDGGSTGSSTAPVPIINNDFVYNTIGLDLVNTAATPVQAYVASNIFSQNHDQTNARNGFAIVSTNPNLITLRNNLFQGNGSDDSKTHDTTATNNLGSGFSAAALTSTIPDSQGNFVGNPGFAFPIDPRPGSDGPANLFVSANFGLTVQSAAINNAWEATAIPTDILGNSAVNISGFGWGLPGYGPRDIGAYEYGGTGGIALGGAFRVVTSSLVPIGGATLAAGGTLITPTSPTSITLHFSGAIDPNSIDATDLVLSGSADNPSNPVQATSLTWIDSDTVQFNLSGALSLPGTLNLSISPGVIKGMNGQGNLSYSDDVVIQIGTPPGLVNPTPYPTTPNPTPTTPTSTGTPSPTTTGTGVTTITPAPAPSPHGPHKKKAAKHVVHKAVHHTAPKHPAPKHHAAPKHAVKTKATHPKATTSLQLSLAGHHKKAK